MLQKRQFGDQPVTTKTGSVAFSQVPVGKETLGRIINVIGEPVDEQGPISKPSVSTHTLPSSFTVLS